MDVGVAPAGRTAEADALERDARVRPRGRSSVLALRGEAGIGKSTLVRWATEEAATAGFTVLTATAIEAESELAFGGLADLLRPILDLLDELPSSQGDALRAAVALGPTAQAEPLGVYSATLGLLAAAAEAGPLLVAIDDAHWLDQPSAEALRFVARRLDAEGIAIVFSLRNGFATPITAADLPEREIGGLDCDATAAVLAAAGHHVAGSVVDRLCSQTDGNPLAMLEVASQLDDKQLLGHRSIDDPLPVGPSIELVFQRRLAPLPATTRTALVVAAADETGRMDVLSAGLAYLGGESTWLGMAARTGLVVIDDGRLQFCHPLARSATYHVASSDQRRAAHYALSTVDVPGVDDATRAWHRAAAAMAPDENVAHELERAAEAAMQRGAPSAAARAFQRAASLTPAPAAQQRRACCGRWRGGG